MGGCTRLSPSLGLPLFFFLSSSLCLSPVLLARPCFSSTLPLSLFLVSFNDALYAKACVTLNAKEGVFGDTKVTMSAVYALS